MTGLRVRSERIELDGSVLCNGGPSMTRVCDVAVEVLQETGDPAVMWGDCGLLDMIAARAGMLRRVDQPMGGIRDLHRRVLNSLSRQPGTLVAGTTLDGRNRRVRIFWLLGREPRWG